MPVEAASASTDDQVATELRAALKAACGIQSPVLELAARPGGTVYGLKVSGGAAISVWEKLHARIAKTGYYPVVLGDGREVQCLTTWNKLAASPTDVLDKATKTSPQVWFKNALEKYPPSTGTQSPFPQEPAQWYSIPPKRLGDDPLPEVAIALVPTRSSWEVPAWLGVGSDGESNGGLRPEIHVALLKHWEERFEAHLVGINHDTVEVRVNRPPGDHETALQVAREHYAYASEGIASFDVYARLLVGSRIWTFWWSM